MTGSIDILPKDEVELAPDDQRVLERLYAMFDGNGGNPLLADQVAYALKGMVTRVSDRLQGQALASYVNRSHDPVGGYRVAPSLRAAIRLNHRADLQNTWDLYAACYAQFTPENRLLDTSGLTPELAESIPRLRHILERESFASFVQLQSGGSVTVRINASILDAESLASYLGLRGGIEPLRRKSEPIERASLLLSAISLTNIRSCREASVSNLGRLTALAGPNEAGKSNVLRAISFAARTATHGFRETHVDWRSLRRLAGDVGHSQIRLALLEPDRKYTWVYDLYSSAAQRDREELRKVPSDEVNLAHYRASGTLRAHADFGTASLTSESGESTNWSIERGESVLAGIQDLNRFRDLIAVRNALDSWRLFHFETTALRGSALNGPGLLADGSNLPSALLSLAERDERAFKLVSESFADLLAEAPALEAERGLSGGAILQLKERGLVSPLKHVDFSDGMLRILALLVLAYDPTPPSLVMIEEPENGLYPRLIEAMVDVIRQLSRRTQVVLTTHSVTLLNRLNPEELVFVYRRDGATQLQRVDTRADIRAFVGRTGLGTQLIQGNFEDQPE